MPQRKKKNGHTSDSARTIKAPRPKIRRYPYLKCDVRSYYIGPNAQEGTRIGVGTKLKVGGNGPYTVVYHSIRGWGFPVHAGAGRGFQRLSSLQNDRIPVEIIPEPEPAGCPDPTSNKWGGHNPGCCGPNDPRHAVAPLIPDEWS